MRANTGRNEFVVIIFAVTSIVVDACAPFGDVTSTGASSTTTGIKDEDDSPAPSASGLPSSQGELSEDGETAISDMDSEAEASGEVSQDSSQNTDEEASDVASDEDDESSDPTGPKFDFIGPDMPIPPTQCEQEGLEDPMAGVYCVFWHPKHIFLGDSDGDGYVEVGVTRDPGHRRSIFVFEQTGDRLEELVDSPFDLPITSAGIRPESARMVAFPRSLGPEQDWLAMLESTAIERDSESGGPFIVAGSAMVLYPPDTTEGLLLSDWRNKGDWRAQAVALDSGRGYAAVLADRKGQLTVQVRDAQDQWGKPTMLHDLLGMPVGIETADINADGHQDIVVFGFNYPGDAPPTHQGIAVRFGDGQGDFSTLQHNQVDHQVYAIVEGKLGDVTGDGLLDAILMDETELHVVAGVGDGLFAGDSPQTILIPGSSSDWNLTAIHAADFNGDQRVDVALSNCQHNMLHILLANPDGQLELISSTPTVDCVNPQYLTDSLNALDVNGDGHLDLLALGDETETLRVYFGDGQGGFNVH